MAQLWRSYTAYLARYPWTVQVGTTGSLFVAGDLIAQFAVERKSVAQYSPARTAKLAAFGFVFAGPAIRAWYLLLERTFGPGTGPAVARNLPYRARDSGGTCLVNNKPLGKNLSLAESTNMFGQSTDNGVKTGGRPSQLASVVLGRFPALSKMVCDQLFFAPFFLASYIATLGALNGQEWAEVRVHLGSVWWPTLVRNWQIWPAVQMANFYLVPFHHRVLVVNLVALFWNTYLSIVGFRDPDAASEDPDATSENAEEQKML